MILFSSSFCGEAAYMADKTQQAASNNTQQPLVAINTQRVVAFPKRAYPNTDLGITWLVHQPYKYAISY